MTSQIKDKRDQANRRAIRGLKRKTFCESLEDGVKKAVRRYCNRQPYRTVLGSVLPDCLAKASDTCSVPLTRE